MVKYIRLALKVLILTTLSGAANAACPTFHALSNGTTADATAVMDNFNYILGCPGFTGNVGIGTTTPNYAAYLAGNSVLSLYGSGGLSGGPGGVLELVSGAPVADGNIVGDIAFENPNLTSSVRLAIIRSTVSGTASNNGGGRIEFFTKADGGGLSRAVSIANNGFVGIGTITPAQALEVNGQIKVNSLASASGTALCINASVISSCSSSRRYKEDIRDASFGLKEVLEMRPVTFKWKERDEEDFGFIAEEVAKIDPHFVTYKGGKIEGVKYTQLTAVLVNAVKQLKSTSERQALEIDRLRGLNTAAVNEFKQQAKDARIMRAQLDALERRLVVRTVDNRITVHH